MTPELGPTDLHQLNQADFTGMADAIERVAALDVVPLAPPEAGSKPMPIGTAHGRMLRLGPTPKQVEGQP